MTRASYNRKQTRVRMVSTDEKHKPKRLTTNSTFPSPSHFVVCSHAYVDLTSDQKREIQSIFTKGQSLSLSCSCTVLFVPPLCVC
ncbi:hypothetical protein K457DRAFT_788976 [Linnemannia elongata AG-77]|uniref:Uncharacterized protein n=1 Tax=Linnemannia elongata AG-77 TaxID=1314771 RepID=A0A197JLE2_9FUNG|nr:hypothetical protein K457DRAFT_788976 [Linnemannia elongata AG-77]